MVDESFKVWLIEINGAPACAQSVTCSCLFILNIFFLSLRLSRFICDIHYLSPFRNSIVLVNLVFSTSSVPPGQFFLLFTIW